VWQTGLYSNDTDNFKVEKPLEKVCRIYENDAQNLQVRRRIYNILAQNSDNPTFAHRKAISVSGNHTVIELSAVHYYTSKNNVYS